MNSSKQVLEFSKQVFNQFSIVNEKLDCLNKKLHKTSQNLDYIQESQSDIIRRLSKIESNQNRVQDKLPTKQEIQELTGKLDTKQPKDIEQETKRLIEQSLAIQEELKSLLAEVKNLAER